MTLYAPEPSRSRYDVVIVGGGIMGAAAAWFLAASEDFDGTVLVVERDPTYERASTTLTNSCIRQQFSTEVNIRISQFAAAYIRSFREELGGDPEIPEIRLEEFGYLYLAGDREAANVLRHNHAIQVGCGVGTRLVSPKVLAEVWPFISPDGIELASHNPRDEGWFDGQAMFDWWRRKARARGVEFVADRVTALARMGRDVMAVQLASGAAVAPGWVVNAAGPRAAEVARMVRLPLPVEPRRRYSFLFEAEPLGGTLPLVIDPAGVHVRSDGGEGRRFLAGCPPAEDRAAAYDDFSMEDDVFEERVWPVLARRIPAFERLRLVNSWVGHYAYNTLDRNAVVGPDPEIRNFLWMNGFSGHGLQQAPAMGRGIAEIVAHGAYRALDLRPLGYARVMTHAPLTESAVI
jgi:glycine/D-amino acid oxidase-like deaminating enzyme